MNVCLLYLILEGELNEEIGHAFGVIDGDILNFPDDKSELIRLFWLGPDVVYSFEKEGVSDIDDFEEERDLALGDGAGGEVEVSAFDRRGGEVAPLFAEEPVFEVDERLADDVVPRQVVLVPDLES